MTSPLHSAEMMALQREKIALKEREVELREGLPFLHGWKWYTWARTFYDSTNKINLLCAANQISKSSTQIRKAINWATDQSMWDALWGRKPTQFWYLYPTSNQASIEFETKWKQFLPKGKFKDDPIYGWTHEIKNKEIFAIHFRSGVHLYFKTYAQDSQALQTGTCDAIFCDEELPIDLYDELIFRISASDGYFHMVFTATLGQDFWRLAMDPGPGEVENLVGALKQTVSMYDCQEYSDGTPSYWTTERIGIVKARCKNDEEIQKRIFGKFIMEVGGRKYGAFNVREHMKPWHPVPKDWHVYCAVDPGGGGKSHSAAIAFVAVRPDHRQGRVFLGWRGDGIGNTTAGDVVDKFIALKRENNITPVLQLYDWASKDFFEIASRMNEPFMPADKAEAGVQTLNTLFKSGMLSIYETSELQKLSQELLSLRKETSKTKAKDDFCDALRYAVTRIPWDWAGVAGAGAGQSSAKKEVLTPKQQEIQTRRKDFEEGHYDEEAEQERIDAEIEECNEAYGNDF